MTNEGIRGETQPGVETAIEVRDLAVAYGSVRAIANATFGFRGASVGLLGPNGAGKSTLIKVLLGLIRPKHGVAFVLGFDVRRHQKEVRRLVGYVPERDCHIPGMSAVDYVTLGGELAGMPRRDAIRRAHEMLHFVGLGEARYRAVDTYSAGMKQRVKLAQALVHDPQLLFLDEPTNGLDPAGRSTLLDIMRDLARQKGIRIVLSSHLLRDVEFVCDEVVVMREGRTVHHGTIEELTRLSELHWRVRVRGDLTAFAANLDARGARLQAAGRESFDVELPADSAPELILTAARDAGCQLREMKRRELTLEDALLDVLATSERGD